MQTCEQMRHYSEAQQTEMTKKAKGGTWDPNWRPHCMQKTVPCSAGLLRMDRTDYGFKCRKCGNIIGFDLQRLAESPLNDAKYVKAVLAQNQPK